MTAVMIACPGCAAKVSTAAFTCPSCGHPLRTPKRGVFGRIFKWSFILFNILMIFWIVAALNLIGEASSQITDEWEQAGNAIGSVIGVGMILSIWVMGDIILGLLVLFTRPRSR